MKGIIKKLESGKGYEDRQPRATIKVEGAASMYDELTVPVGEIHGPVPILLDSEIRLTLEVIITE